MYSHVFVGVQDFERALRFYGVLMQVLGHEKRFVETDRPWAGWQPAGGGRPLFLIGTPFDGQPHVVGNGQMTAFAAADRAMVRAAYAAALAHGAHCEGPPGLRPHYHEHYYGAYVRDTEGNKLGFACHAPDA